MSAATPVVRLGTRRSPLALAQSRSVAAALSVATGHRVELVEITTRGDVDRGALAQIGGTGVFVTALRDALLAGEVDLAVHSLKDLPTAPAAGLVVAAVPGREDPSDVLVARDGLTLRELPPGATIGTGSPRRTALLRAAALAWGRDLDVVPIRGNVDTRVRAVREGRLDAVVLAAAGLTRLGRRDEATELLDLDLLPPAPGQGALAVECREDAPVRAALAALDDPTARAAVTAERALLAALEAGCTAPVAALAVPVVPPVPAAPTAPARPAGPAGPSRPAQGGPTLHLRAVVAAPDGSRALRTSATAPLDDAVGLGSRAAASLLADGAAALVDAPAREHLKETVS